MHQPLLADRRLGHALSSCFQLFFRVEQSLVQPVQAAPHFVQFDTREEQFRLRLGQLGLQPADFRLLVHQDASQVAQIAAMIERRRQRRVVVAAVRRSDVAQVIDQVVQLVQWLNRLRSDASGQSVVVQRLQSS